MQSCWKNEELINYPKFEVIKPSTVRLTQFSQQEAGFLQLSEGVFFPSPICWATGEPVGKYVAPFNYTSPQAAACLRIP